MFEVIPGLLPSSLCDSSVQRRICVSNLPRLSQEERRLRPYSSTYTAPDSLAHTCGIYECAITLLSGARNDWIQNGLRHFHSRASIPGKSTAYGWLIVHVFVTFVDLQLAVPWIYKIDGYWNPRNRLTICPRADHEHCYHLQYKVSLMHVLYMFIQLVHP